MRTSHAHATASVPVGAHNHRAAVSGAPEDVAVLTLDEDGLILDCSRSAEALFKYSRNELMWRHVSMLLPQLAKVDLMQNGEPNPGLRFLCRIGRRFQTVAHGGEHFSSELFLTVLYNEGRGGLLLIVRPIAEPAWSESDQQPT